MPGRGGIARDPGWAKIQQWPCKEVPLQQQGQHQIRHRRKKHSIVSSRGALYTCTLWLSAAWAGRPQLSWPLTAAPSLTISLSSVSKFMPVSALTCTTAVLNHTRQYPQSTRRQ